MSIINFIILAGGQGVRMKSSLPKPLQVVGNMTMLERAVISGRQLDPDRIIVVVRNKEVEKMAEELGCITAWQKEPVGTADALRTALLKCGDSGMVIVTCVDIPLIPVSVFEGLRLKHDSEHNYMNVLTAVMPDPEGYGRVIKEDGSIIKIIEEKEASEEEKKIKNVNCGIYSINRSNLEEYLSRIERAQVKKEYYLTDLVEIVSEDGLKVGEVICDHSYVQGVNTAVQLEEMERLLSENK